MQEIKIRTKGNGFLAVEELTNFQGGLKKLSEENYEKLKSEILQTGFTEPITIWVNGGKNYILNGHQRAATLKKMAAEGLEIPKIPVNFIEAADSDEAKRMLLAMTSQYGEMTNFTLAEFIKNSNLEIEKIKDGLNFPEVDLEQVLNYLQFKNEEVENLLREQDESKVEKDLEIYQNNTIKQIVLYFTTEDFKKVLAGLDLLLEKFKVEDYSSLVKKISVGEIKIG